MKQVHATKLKKENYVPTHQIGMPAGIFCALIRKRKNKNKNNDLKINRGFFAIRYVFVRTYRKKKHPSSAAKCLHCCSGTIVTQCVA
ncbi:MAG: hypothetical protein Q4E66_05215, partial [Comamonadaceae bacterium]|nr:hypothetical protein [Comamonadaceae bacterium]